MSLGSCKRSVQIAQVHIPAEPHSSESLSRPHAEQVLPERVRQPHGKAYCRLEHIHIPAG